MDHNSANIDHPKIANQHLKEEEDFSAPNGIQNPTKYKGSVDAMRLYPFSKLGRTYFLYSFLT